VITALCLLWCRFNQYSGWPVMPGRMMSQRGGARGRAPMHAGRGGYYGGGTLTSSINYSYCCVIHDFS